MATFPDRLLVHLSDPGNVAGFLAGAGLDAFLTTDFQRRLDTGYWQIQQVAAGAATVRDLQQPCWQRLRVLGREEVQGNTPTRTTIDHSIYGFETARWIDVSLNVDTTWTVDQIPGSIDVTPTAPVHFDRTANLLSVLRVDAANHPLDRSGTPVTTVTIDGEGRLRTDPPQPVTLRLDPNSGVLREPDGAVRDQILLELFPRLGVPGLGLPLGDDGQPLRDLRVDSSGVFTDLAGAPAATDPRTGLPVDGSTAQTTGSCSRCRCVPTLSPSLSSPGSTCWSLDPPTCSSTCVACSRPDASWSPAPTTSSASTTMRARCRRRLGWSTSGTSLTAPDSTPPASANWALSWASWCTSSPSRSR
jgi:hypothetical protein